MSASPNLSVSAIPAFNDNYIWCLTVGDGRAAVVDPGDPAPVLEALQAQSLTLDTIIITHHHGDHTGGLMALKDATGCRVVGPANPAIKGIDTTLADSDTIDIMDLRFDVLEVPGHTLDHIAYWGHGALFCGDTLFAGGCGRVFEGTFPMMRASLAKLRQLPSDTAVYCAHEYTLANLRFAQAADPDNTDLATRVAHCQRLREQDIPTVPSRLADELQTNPFLRWDDPAVIAHLAQQNRVTGSQPDDVFAGLRQWKDNF